MAVRQFTTSFSSLSDDEHLRYDEKFHYFLHTTNWNLFGANSRLIKLKDILIDDYENFIFDEGEEYKGIPTGQNYLDEDGYIINHEQITLENHPNRLKYKAKNSNLLISSLRLAKSPALHFGKEDLSGFVFSNGFYVFNVNNKWNLKFVLYLLRTKRLKSALDNYIYRGIGISAYKDRDLKRIKIPIVSKEKQDAVVKEIEPIEENIRSIKKRIKPHQKAIDDVFTREFGFDISQFEKLTQIKKYFGQLSDFANNIDIRYSVKFHRNAGRFVIQELKKVTPKKIKHFIAEPIVLGVSVSPSNYDENGDYYYVSMANIKNWKFESEDAKLVSDDYSKSNQSKTVALNDILIARSGEGTIGKVALIEDEELKGIFADFTMRIRLKNYNPTFAYYYFRTTYFQYLVEINKKGLGNNTNIFPSQIQELPLIDISLARQSKIVEEIKKELDEQDVIKIEVSKEREKIDAIIENAIL